MPRLSTAGDIINRVAVEVGLSKDSDPLASIQDHFVQLAELLNAAGQELIELHPWQTMHGFYEIVTKAEDTGTYDLPDDFAYMIDQTGWEATNRIPMGGPLSAQDWAYLKGRDLVSQTIYASFQLRQGQFQLFPNDPVPAGLEISFTYMKRNWVAEFDTEQERDTVERSSDTVLYDPILIIKYLKAKFLDAKGFDASSARLDFENMFLSRTGKDEGAPILSAGSNSRGFPYMSPYYNTPDTGFGR
jgi:hypothetical protein